MEFRQEEYYEEGAYEEGGYHDGDGEGEEEYGGWGEIAVAPAGHEDHPDQVNCVRFDAAEESLWVGSAGGVVSQATLPTLARYSAVAAHGQGVVSLRSPGESVVSLAPGTLCMHYSGCVPSVHYNDEVRPALPCPALRALAHLTPPPRQARSSPAHESCRRWETWPLWSWTAAATAWLWAAPAAG